MRLLRKRLHAIDQEFYSRKISHVKILEKSMLHVMYTVVFLYIFICDSQEYVSCTHAHIFDMICIKMQQMLRINEGA